MAQAHYTVMLPYRTAIKRTERSALYTKLKSAGFDDSRYFRFTEGNTKEQEAQKALAQAYADQFAHVAGALEVCEGCFI